MDFFYTEEQQMLADTVQRWLVTDYNFAADLSADRKAAAANKIWQSLAEMGLLGLNVREADGGLGGTAVDIYIVMHQFGRALLRAPFVSTAVVCAGLLARAGGELNGALLRAIVAGERRLAVASLEPTARFDLSDVVTSASSSGSEFVLNGRKAVVLDGDQADTFLVSARTAGARRDTQGITLFLVDRSLPGVSVKGYPAIDGSRVAEVEFSAAQVAADRVVGDLHGGYGPLEEAIDVGVAALCAEAVGAMEMLVELTVQHLRARKQFGRAIGDFQALQHRVADMQIQFEQARSMALLAAARVDALDRAVRRRALSAAKVMIGRAGRFVGEQAVQLHGGMGITSALAVGWYFKRLTCIDMTWGNIDHHIASYGDVLEVPAARTAP